MTKNTTVASIIGLVILGVLAVIFGPMITIWMLNTLFPLSIAYTFKTWLAALLLHGLVSGTRYYTKRQ